MSSHFKRFFFTWMTASAPFGVMGFAAGRFTVWAHGYSDRGLANLASFAAHRLIGPSLAIGLTFGFWLAAVFLALKLAARHPRRARRSFGIILMFGLLIACVFIVIRIPEWKVLADSAVYGRQKINLFVGVPLLALMTFIQSSMEQRLFWTSVSGLLAILAAFPAAILERRLIPGEPRDSKPRRHAAIWGIASLAVNLLLVLDLAAARPPRAAPDYPPVFWISIDTLRADHLPLYGYERNTSPNLAALAADGVLVDQFISQAPWTLPAHATMFTGLEPSKHGLHMQTNRLARRTPLFPEILKERGYRTGAIVTSLLLAPTFGYGPGFDMYDMNIRYNAGQVVNLGLKWMDGSSAPTFLFLHVFEPHFPYAAPPPFIGKFGRVDRRMMAMQNRNFFEFVQWARAQPEVMQEIEDRYDEEILYADHALGRFFSELKKRGLYDRAWIVVVSDHGEEFLEHGNMGHSATMYEELTRVPLIVKAPGGQCAGSRLRDTQVPQSAIAELILSAANPPAKTADDRRCDGADGVPRLLHRLATADPVIGECRVFGPVRFMARTPELKMHSPAKIEKADMEVDHDTQLFDLRADPGETQDIFEKGSAPVLEGAIADAFKAVAGEKAAPRHRLDPETIRQLKSLGYIQ